MWTAQWAPRLRNGGEDGEFPVNKKHRKVGRPIRRVKRERGKRGSVPASVYCISPLPAQCFPKFNSGLEESAIAVGS